MISLEALMKLKKRVLIVGPPGIGKTQRAHATSAACGRELVTMRANLSERVDFSGALVPDLAKGVTKTLPLELLLKLKTTKKPTTLFIDDLGQAPMDVQAALMQLFDDGFLSPDVLIWGATNRPGDKAGVTALCEPLRSRFDLAFAIATPGSSESPDGAVRLGDWKEEVTSWCEWAMDRPAGPAAPEIIAWHRSTTGRTLYAWKPNPDPALRMPDYRTWETVIDLWNAGIRDVNTLGAAIGRPAAAEFCAFASLADKLPTPDQVWMDPKGAPIPEEAEARFLITSMLAAAVDEKKLSACVIYMTRLPRIFAALLARDIHRKHATKVGGNKDFIKWFTENEALFNTRS